MYKDHHILHMSGVQVAILKGLWACRHLFLKDFLGGATFHFPNIIHIADIHIQYVEARADWHLEGICKALLYVENC